mmetsp:Transcript_37082/g.85667  ORF Transcript_37082/g.85667 Transcript_37082/m.85667 type:complete len:200 (-) Transcript_37082:167-766(-)
MSPFHIFVRATHFAFLDDDDAWLPNKIEVQLEVMQRDGIGLLSSDALTPLKNTRCQEEAGNNFWVPWNITDNSAFRPWNGNNGPLHREFGAVHKALPVQMNISRKFMHERNPFVLSSTIVTKEALGIGFDTTLGNGGEDHGLWKAIVDRYANHRATLLREPLAVYDHFHGRPMRCQEAPRQEYGRERGAASTALRRALR